MGFSAVVTGASGFIGSHVAQALLASRADVTLFLRPESDPWRLATILDRVRIVRVDPMDYSTVLAAMKVARPRVIYHVGWAGVTANTRETESQVISNVTSSMHLLSAAIAVGAEAWVGVGSQAEYEPGEGGVLDETRAVDPKTVYGSSKASVYFLSRALCRKHSMRFVWLRLFAAYGPGDSPDYLIPYTILRLLRELPALLTPGEQRWDYVYVQDAAEAIVQAGLKADGTYNLGAGKAYTVRDVARQIGRIVGRPELIKLGARPYATNQIMHLQADISALQRAIGWSPRTALGDGLEATVKWFRDNLHRFPIASE